MRRRRWVRAAAGAGLFLLGWPAASFAASCDQYDPTALAHTAQITLTSRDFVDQGSDEMRTFIETGSVGRVAVGVVSAMPRDIVRSLSAVPQISRLSSGHGEELKGIAVSVALRSNAPAATIVVTLRQVCAQYFHNTFLYY